VAPWAIVFINSSGLSGFANQEVSSGDYLFF